MLCGRKADQLRIAKHCRNPRERGPASIRPAKTLPARGQSSHGAPAGGAAWLARLIETGENLPHDHPMASSFLLSPLTSYALQVPGANGKPLMMCVVPCLDRKSVV